MEILKNEKGKYIIQNKAFKDIAQAACLKVKNVKPAKKENDFVDISVDKNKMMLISVSIRIKQGVDLNKICLNLQEEINDNILLMTGVDCKNINIDIQGFIAEKKKKS